MANCKFLFPLIFLIAPYLVNAQEITPNDYNPFAKGRFITGINGSIRSGSKTRSSAVSVQESNAYDFTIGTQSGIFVRNRLLFGGSLQVTKSKSENQSLQLNQEVFTIGPWSRYYLGKDSKGSLFLETNIFFAKENIDTQSSSINQELKGVGLGGALGAGFTYVVNPNIGFDLTLAYNFIQFYANDRDLITNTKNSVNFGENFITVTFGFRIMLNEFFF